MLLTSTNCFKIKGFCRINQFYCFLVIFWKLLGYPTLFTLDYSGDSSTWVENRGIVTQNSTTGNWIDDNILYSMRQAGYFNPNSSGYVTHNVVFNTRGWVVDGATMQFSGNSWGETENAVDIALLSGTTSGVPYSSVTDLQNNNSVATISDQR